jgi:hypothetical protein
MAVVKAAALSLPSNIAYNKNGSGLSNGNDTGKIEKSNSDDNMDSAASSSAIKKKKKKAAKSEGKPTRLSPQVS